MKISEGVARKSQEGFNFQVSGRKKSLLYQKVAHRGSQK